MAFKARWKRKSSSIRIPYVSVYKTYAAFTRGHDHC